ncbi:MAG: FG-GAP-like repeat-containing protein [Terriglobales bacterium]
MRFGSAKRTTLSHRPRCRTAGVSILIIAAALLASQVLLGQNTPAPEVNLQIIVVDSPAQAQEVLDQLKNGADFAALAKEKSTDATANNGGYMGATDPATLRSELRDALSGIAPGQLTRAIKIPTGYAILKVLPPNEPSAGASANPSRILPLEATGTIRYLPTIAGTSEADLAFRSFSKPDGWSQDLKAICEIRTKSYSTIVDQLEKNQLRMNAEGLAQGTPLDTIETHYALANLYSYKGTMDKAVAQWETAYQIAKNELPGAMPELEEVLGIAYLHKSEMENDVYRNPGERCIFPPQAEVRYQKTGDSEKAVEYFTKYLERKPDAYDIEWLLNVAYMTLGGYPARVPQKYLIAPSLFKSAENVGRFVDVAPAAGIKTLDASGGIIVDDFDNDGLLDVVLSDFDQCAPLHFFHNNGDGTFTDRTVQAGLSDQLGGLNLVQTDYNNDGCLDILVLRGAWQFPQRKSLLRNNCNGTFTDVTAASGLAEPATDTQTAVWADIDNDGFLDLIVGNENAPLQLFHNNGNGTFTDIAHAAGVDRIGYTKAIAAADYDNDGYVDFYVSNLNGDNFLFHNNHNRTFTEVGLQAGVQQPWQSFPAWFFDYDNDGWPDLFVASYYVSVDESVRTYLGLPHNAETLKLYRNLGNGTFKDVTSEVGLDKVFMPMGSNFGDIDNDGYLDIYLGTGNPSYASLLPNVMLRNHDGKYFVDVTASSGTGELHKGHGVAFADIDNRGFEDLLEEVGGATPGDAHAFRLFENPGNGNDWIELHLIGVKSNRVAIGARIKVTVENEGGGQRSIYRTVGSGGSFGASPLQQHIGLGKSARIVDLEIWWPANNTRQHFANVATNQFLEIKEFATSYTKLERHPFKLGGLSPNSLVLPKNSQKDGQAK